MKSFTCSKRCGLSLSNKKMKKNSTSRARIQANAFAHKHHDMSFCDGAHNVSLVEKNSERNEIGDYILYQVFCFVCVLMVFVIFKLAIFYTTLNTLCYAIGWLFSFSSLVLCVARTHISACSRMYACEASHSIYLCLKSLELSMKQNLSL